MTIELMKAAGRGRGRDRQAASDRKLKAHLLLFLYRLISNCIQTGQTSPVHRQVKGVRSDHCWRRPCTPSASSGNGDLDVCLKKPARTGTVRGKRGSHSIPYESGTKEKKRNVRSNPGAPNGNLFLIMAANKPS